MKKIIFSTLFSFSVLCASLNIQSVSAQTEETTPTESSSSIPQVKAERPNMESSSNTIPWTIIGTILAIIVVGGRIFKNIRK